jgi:hypothetical protein
MDTSFGSFCTRFRFSPTFLSRFLQTDTPDVADPEHSNPFSTSAWELANLKFHIHPTVREQAHAAGSLKLLQMPAETPYRLLSGMKKDAEDVYIKFRRASKTHPLKGKGGRQQIRFITPRKEKVTLLGVLEE